MTTTSHEHEMDSPIHFLCNTCCILVVYASWQKIPFADSLSLGEFLSFVMDFGSTFLSQLPRAIIETRRSPFFLYVLHVCQYLDKLL